MKGSSPPHVASSGAQGADGALDGVHIFQPHVSPTITHN